MILDALKPILDVVNKVVPDGAEKNRLQAELEKASLEVDKQRLGALGNMLGSQSMFVAGAIPAILWILVLSIFNNYILMPWVAVFGATIPDISLPSEVWTLAGWIITGLLAKKAVDGNAFYSKTGELIKPSRSEPHINMLTKTVKTTSEPQTNQVIFETEPTMEIEKDQDYYDKRFDELSAKFK